MSRLSRRTRTANFFVTKYNRDSLREAVELAARKEREALLPGMDECVKIPIDVESIARHRGIIHIGTLTEDGNRDATILSGNQGYTVRMGSKGTLLRDRFSLAHEIGHTLFMHGTKHLIGVMSKEEIAAEEYICNMFAAALLMPRGFVSKFVSQIPDGEPLSILAAFENASRKLQVSLPALIMRIGHVRATPRFSFIALSLRYMVNKYTGTTPCLRVETCSAMGSLLNMRTWNNRSAIGLNLFSADHLFTAWRTALPEGGEPTGGRYTIVKSDIERVADNLKWVSENIQLSVRRDSRWFKETKPMLAINCLYARRGWREDKAYVISLVKSQKQREKEASA